MKAKELGLIEGSGCYYCQTMFEPDDEVCLDANFRDYVRVMHLKCSKRNGRLLGFKPEKVKDKKAEPRPKQPMDSVKETESKETEELGGKEVDNIEEEAEALKEAEEHGKTG